MTSTVRPHCTRKSPTGRSPARRPRSAAGPSTVHSRQTTQWETGRPEGRYSAMARGGSTVRDLPGGVHHVVHSVQEAPDRRGSSPSKSRAAVPSGPRNTQPRACAPGGTRRRRRALPGRCSELHPASVTELFGNLVEAAGLPPIRLHDRRHGVASIARRPASTRRSSAKCSATPHARSPTTRTRRSSWKWHGRRPRRRRRSCPAQRSETASVVLPVSAWSPMMPTRPQRGG
jgi:hypothetical protein